MDDDRWEEGQDSDLAGANLKVVIVSIETVFLCGCFYIFLKVPAIGSSLLFADSMPNRIEEHSPNNGLLANVVTAGLMGRRIS